MHMSRKYSASFVLVALMMSALLLSNARAAVVINYGNFNIPSTGVTFTDVSESSSTDAVPLYGPPHTFVTGLDFDPAGFSANSTNGTTDITDGQLNYGLNGQVFSGGGVGINSLTVNESGDYTLAGIGTTGTEVLGGVILHIKVDEVDGMPITPVTFNSNASIAFNLIANPGVVQPWSMSTTVPIAALLTALNIPYSIGATKLEVTSDNQLLAFSETLSAASINKKDYVLTVTPDQHGITPMPEPASIGLFGLALLGSLNARRRRAR
jgi:hypothetical protein